MPSVDRQAHVSAMQQGVKSNYGEALMDNLQALPVLSSGASTDSHHSL